MKRFNMASLVLILVGASALGQESEFRWVRARNDPVLFKGVQEAFSAELTPDGGDSQSHTVPMTVKFVDRVGVRDNSALVLIGEKENQTDPYTVFQAFNFDLRTKDKSPIRGKEMEWFWMWRLEKVTHLTSARDTDVVFEFLTCTECESTRLLAAFHYPSNAGTWALREWSKEDGFGLMIGSDVQYGDDGFYHYDCLHTVSDVTGRGFDDVAVRCQESVQPDPEKPLTRITRDETLLYKAAEDGTLVRIVVRKASEYASAVQDALCATKRSSPLCRKSAATPKRVHRP